MHKVSTAVFTIDTYSYAAMLFEDEIFNRTQEQLFLFDSIFEHSVVPVEQFSSLYLPS
jgi:hypothetical protein